MKRNDLSVVRQAACSAGFTVAELVAAAAILFTVLMGVLGAVEYAGASTRMASMREGAIDVANDQVENDRNIPFYNLGVVYANGSVGMQGAQVPAVQTVSTDRGTYTVTTQVWWPETTKSTYKNVRVTVSWTQPTVGSIAVESAVFGYSSVGNVGDVLLHAVDKENPTVPVSGASITLDPASGSNMTVISDAQGAVFFGQTPIGSATFPDPGTSNSQWLVDVSGLGSPTIHTGAQNLGYVYCQRPCTAAIHVVSTGLPSGLSGATVTLKDKDRNITYTAVTNSTGWATFSAAADTVHQTAGLWISGVQGYTATAVLGAASSAPGTFSLTTGGQNYTGLTLTINDPPSIQVSKKISTSGAALNGVQWTVTLKNPSGVSLGTQTTNADSVTFQTTVAGNYTAIVTGVDGYADNTGFTFNANATAQNQACVVPMQPVFQVGVRMDGSGLPGVNVTVTNTSTHVSIPSVSGANPGVTGSDGMVKFAITVAGTYSVSAVYNGVTYTAANAVLTGGPPAPTYIDITRGSISVGVLPKTGTWSRYVGIYDSSDHYVAYDTVTVGHATVTFTVPPGMYTVVVCGTLASLPLPSNRPADTSKKYKSYYMTSPGVPTNGGAYSPPFTNLAAPN